MIHGLSRCCAAPSGGLVMLASYASAIVQCNTITSVDASRICSPHGAAGSGRSLPSGRPDDKLRVIRERPIPDFAALDPGYEGSASDQPEQNQQHDGAHRRGNDGVDPPKASDRRKVKHVPQPGADISADNADDDIADQAKGSALQDSCGQPTGNRSDDQDRKSTRLNSSHT